MEGDIFMVDMVGEGRARAPLEGATGGRRLKAYSWRSPCGGD